MMKNIFFFACILSAFFCRAQDSLSTSTLREVVITGTRFEVAVEQSGKTIYKIDSAELERNAGKTLADVLNEVPGIQTDGNFSTPGVNLSYYVRGGRNKHTLILIDGMPMNDPASISAQYDLRYIPLAQIESVEILKGGLSTLYGTGATAGVINIRLKNARNERSGGRVDISAASYGTFSQDAHAAFSGKKSSAFISASNLYARGFSAALDADPASDFDDDGLERQNVLLKGGHEFSAAFRVDAQLAFEQFTAGYDAYEFTDAANRQEFRQVRAGVRPQWKYEQGSVEAKVFYHVNDRAFFSAFLEQMAGKHLNGEVIHRHRLSPNMQMLSGLNYQYMSFGNELQKSEKGDFRMLDPYTSVFIDLPSGLNVHAGARLNYHNNYGSELIYNLNPSFLLNQEGAWRYKVLASVSTSYITPSLYQFYSSFGNPELEPERSLNGETGFSVYHGKFTWNAVAFTRKENDPIDFITLVDSEGNYIGGQYRNIVDARSVKGIELDASGTITNGISISGNLSLMDTDRPESFYKIPKMKYGASVTWEPWQASTVSIRYNHTGGRTVFDFFSYSEVSLRSYGLLDVYIRHRLLKDKLTLYGAVNNLLDEDFVALYGYTTRGRNFAAGIRYDF